MWTSSTRCCLLFTALSATFQCLGWTSWQFNQNLAEYVIPLVSLEEREAQLSLSLNSGGTFAAAHWGTTYILTLRDLSYQHWCCHCLLSAFALPSASWARVFSPDIFSMLLSASRSALFSRIPDMLSSPLRLPIIWIAIVIWSIDWWWKKSGQQKVRSLLS